MQWVNGPRLWMTVTIHDSSCPSPVDSIAVGRDKMEVRTKTVRVH